MKGDNHLFQLTELVSFPVQVVKATDDGKDVTFENAAPSGADIELQRIDTGTGEVFEYAERLRGVKVGDEFKPIDPEAIKAIDEATKVKTMVALDSMPLDEARAKYGDRVTGRYFLQVPAKGGSATAFRLTYEALLAEKRAIVTKRTPRSRQQLGIVYADEEAGALVMLSLAFASSVREPDEQVKAHLTAKVDAKQVKVARQVVKAIGDGTALDTETDEALPLRAELVEKAIAGEAIDVPAPVAHTGAQEDVGALLEKSLALATK